MRKAFAAVLTLLCAMPQVAGAQATGAAPADEYFGRLKMSTLGMRNQLQRMVQAVNSDPHAAASSLGMAFRVEEALEDLSKRYPHESWLEGLYVGLERYYAHVPSVDARWHLAHVTQYVHSHFPNSPLDDEATSCATRILLADSNAAPSLCETADDVAVGSAFKDQLNRGAATPGGELTQELTPAATSSPVPPQR